MSTLADVGELEAIRRLIEARGARPSADPAIAVDAGDDAAVLRPRADHDLVVTTDALVEGVHYLPAWIAPPSIGARLATVNLSDAAAMAATPRWALLSMGVRASRAIDDLVAIQRGLVETLAREGATVVGGNVAAVEGAEWWSLTLLAEVARGRAWSRRGASPGDRLAITGRPGRASAGLALARRLGDGARAAEWRALIDAWLAPVARGALATALAPLGAVTAAIDVSDGFAGDLARLCAASGVGAVVREAAWPRDPELERAAGVLGVTRDALRFGPSDDYELLMAIAPEHEAACVAAADRLGVPLAIVGEFTEAAAGLLLAGDDTRPLPARGFDHFGRASR